MDYTSLTLEQLEAENIHLSAERARIRQEQLAINELISQRQAELSAQAKFEALSDHEKRALVQMVTADAIQVGIDTPESDS